MNDAPLPDPAPPGAPEDLDDEGEGPGTEAARPQADDPAEAAERRARLRRIAGPGQAMAAVLALMLTPGSRRERGVWREFCRATPGAETIRADVKRLPSAERLPWLEFMAKRLAAQSVDDREHVLHAARRQMAADGRISVADRLRWLLLRHLMGERPEAPTATASGMDLQLLDALAVEAIGVWSAFLSRQVPLPEGDRDAAFAHDAPAARWWVAVMHLWPQASVRHERPDNDAAVAALNVLQAMPWMLHPLLVRHWFEHALAEAPTPGQLPLEAAEALRIAATLIDSPLPPALAACFVECD